MLLEESHQQRPKKGYGVFLYGEWLVGLVSHRVIYRES